LDQLFLVYAALFALPIFALIFILPNLDVNGISRRFRERMPMKWISHPGPGGHGIQRGSIVAAGAALLIPVWLTLSAASQISAGLLLANMHPAGSGEDHTPARSGTRREPSGT
jgi:hypothetical protein